MRRVVIRDDDTNATTPISCLDRLYRPFMEKGLPVNLSVIPQVRLDTRLPDGKLEGFIVGPDAGRADVKSIETNPELVEYIRNAGFCVAQHGLTHEFIDCKPAFDRDDAVELARRLDSGLMILRNAGFEPSAFVAPQDRLSATAFREAARRFPIISTGWYEWRRLPVSWLPAFAIKKFTGQPHWRIGGTLLLSHPGCLLSRFRDYAGMFDQVRQTVLNNKLTVLVTHWWEYFPDGKPDEEFIAVLHQTADFLAEKEIKVCTFSELRMRKQAD